MSAFSQKVRISLDACKYTLIDGAFFEALCNKYKKYTEIDVFGSLNWESFCRKSFRTNYYDAMPVRKNSQSEETFLEVYKEKEKLLNSLRQVPNCHVKDGITRLRTPNRGAKLSASIEQKGVDTWIAVDAVKLAIEGRADAIEIWTSDADLFPVFEVLQETKCLGILRYEHGKTIDELIYSADQAVPIKMRDIAQYCGGRATSALNTNPIIFESRRAYFEDYGLKKLEEFSDGDQAVEVCFSQINSNWHSIKSSSKTATVSSLLYPLLEALQFQGYSVDIGGLFSKIRADGSGFKNL